MSKQVLSPVPLERKHPRKDFDCGDPVLNDWLVRYSIQNQKKGLSRSYVSLSKDKNSIAGFYTLAFGSVRKEESTEEVAHGAPAHPIPVLVVARLAIDHKYQGIGLGRSLMRDAIIRAISASEIAGLRAVVVDAKDERAAAFYTHLGFTAIKQTPLFLMVTLKEAADLLSE